MIMVIQSWTEVVVNSLQSLWFGAINFLPSLIGALIVIIIGLVIASGLRSLIEKVVGALKIDSLLRKVGLSPFFERAQILISVILIVLVLLQERSSGLSGVFGGGGNEFYSQRRGFERLIFYATIVLIITFAVLSLINLSS